MNRTQAPPAATAPRPGPPARRGPVPLLLGMAAALLLSAGWSVTIGAAGLSLREVLTSIGVHLGAPLEALAPLRDSIVWDLRLPRVLLSAVVGAGLAVCGTVLQAMTRNMLADPYLLGVSSGASTGAVTVLILGTGAALVPLPLGAFAGALLAFACVLALLGRSMGSVTRTVLAGVMISQLFSAVTSLVVMAAGDAEHTRSLAFWLLGSLAGADWGGLAACTAMTAAGLAVCWSRARTLDAFAFGEDAAATLGITVRRAQLVLYTSTAFMAGALVAVSGAIGFVGLIIPHAARRLLGTGHRGLLPGAALLGAVFLVWADTAARTLFAPQELPVGVLTALIGVPAFALILRRRVRAS